MIHDRDWIAGRTIRANIMDGIEKKQKSYLYSVKVKYLYTYSDES